MQICLTRNRAGSTEFALTSACDLTDITSQNQGQILRLNGTKATLSDDQMCVYHTNIIKHKIHLFIDYIFTYIYNSKH